MQEKSVETGVGWVAVAVMMVIFWPIGLFLLVRKLHKDKAATFNSGKPTAALGWILLVIGALGFLVSLSADGNPSVWLMTVVFLAGGLILLHEGHKVQKNGRKYRLYISIVVNEGETKIGDIAAAAGVDEKIAERDLQEMLDKGYFNGHINHKNQELVLASTHDLENVQFEVVRCDNCGADNKIIKGRPRKCAYCRSLIRT
jgi:hypothetical protein